MSPQHIAAEHLRINAANDGRWFALDFETYLAALYGSLLRPGMIALDCGANIGQHTFQMATAVQPGGLVVAVEPIDALVARLRQEVAKRHLPSDLVRILRCGVSSRSGQADFYQVDDAFHHGVSGLRMRIYPAGIVVKPVVIEVTTLDAICVGLPRLDFVKLDIEGAEFDALRGGVNTLRQFRPVITMEQAPSDPEYFGYAWDDLFEYLKAMDYRLYDLFGLEYTGTEHLQECMVWDFVGMPSEYADAQRIFSTVRECMIATGVKGLSDVEHGAQHKATERSVVEGCLVRKPGNCPVDQKVYFVENGTKRWVTTSEWITAHGMKWPSDVRIIPAEDLDAMCTGQPLP